MRIETDNVNILFLDGIVYPMRNGFSNGYILVCEKMVAKEDVAIIIYQLIY